MRRRDAVRYAQVATRYRDRLRAQVGRDLSLIDALIKANVAVENRQRELDAVERQMRDA